MARREPVAEPEPRFSSDGAAARAWTEGRERLEGAEVYWISTVRPDGRPHVVGCVFFSDPDGNRWCVQQIPARG